MFYFIFTYTQIYEVTLLSFYVFVNIYLNNLNNNILLRYFKNNFYNVVIIIIIAEHNM